MDGRRVSGRRARLRAAGVATMVALALTGCGEHRGDVLAADAATADAKSLNEALGDRNRPRDAATIAATEILGEARPLAPPEEGSTVRREALAWSGRVSGDEHATIDVRFVASVPERSAGSFGDTGHSAGEATRCYRYELRMYRETSYREIDCPSGAAPPPPSAAPVPKVPDDGSARLTAVLRTATPQTLAGKVRAAFPQEWITVDTTTHEGALVAAVGVPAERDCLLLVRTPAGRIEAPGYDRVWLEPGEIGCRTALYTAPPR
ncbi:hypothetical protein [Micromonospora robiginosa]|uniref:Lipoprotein n=1 Tax=Micromonospora robiginosa TaxID=2749844 RepID=A0A7L6BFA3_9ACTN|nr:hypothetical protein [Micromonospora ferruginea]QLQ40501.2 hypothetical protein H1D33_24340 [Micromonospora ferruginea]